MSHLKDSVIDHVYVKSVKKSIVPKIIIADLEGSNLKISMDIHQEVFNVKEGEKLEFVLSHSLPDYKEGEDFCARGVVVGFKEDERGFRVIVSLYGFLVVIYPRDREILKDYKPTDEIYLCLKKF
ncbi:MAG: DNA-directed RNA polymerase subunit G [Desulfurococcales archaeon]|nr:DNA-directed RNA polymerase subunit G [Desulfurococcales archaeon]